jgi:hypothetical protein
METIEDRVSDHDITLARHEEQIDALKESEKKTSDQLTWQTRLAITTLLGTVGTLLAVLLKH